MRRSSLGEPVSVQENNGCDVNNIKLPLTLTSNGTYTDFLENTLSPTRNSEKDGVSNRLPWNQIESETLMAAPASPLKIKFPEAGYAVIKRRTKVAKGVQTDETRKRCWRHSRGVTATEKFYQENQEVNQGTLTRCQSAKNELAHQIASSKSTLRNALPHVNFSRWSRPNK
ncbi:uncharacterized protein LOC118185618, partial [Stegodyphus dumicola]|uniref:uncharacterized protein LOC118185618 n=1 Tax=Stegodyphus dumicola TaxID=202533 RepID=UPI0015AB3CC7